MTAIPRPTRSTSPATSKKAPSKAAKPKAAKSKAVRPKVARPKATAKAARPKVAKPKAAAPKVAARKVAKPKTAVAKAIGATPAALTPTAPKPPHRVKVKLSNAAKLAALATTLLDDGKAEAIVTIDMLGKSDIADYMVIATGNSARQVAALAQRLSEGFKAAGHGKVSIEGMRQGDWVLLDAGDVIVHLFRPETRTYYNLEKMWGEVLAEAAGQ